MNYSVDWSDIGEACCRSRVLDIIFIFWKAHENQLGVSCSHNDLRKSLKDMSIVEE